jgi:hypothetical protein
LLSKQVARGRHGLYLPGPPFLETVTSNEQRPLKVFIQLNDDCNGVYVQRQATGFQVVELGRGNSSAHFTYRVVTDARALKTPASTVIMLD